jgi:hypothetical protein
LIDLLASDVDLKGRQGDPPDRCQGFQSAHEPPMSPVDPSEVEVGLLDVEPDF